MTGNKILFLACALFVMSAAAVFACEFVYVLGDSEGAEKRVIPGVPVTLEAGKEYTLSVSYREDHNKCLVTPQETLFLVEEERWRTGKDYLALVLLSVVPWESDGRNHSTAFTFIAAKPGIWPIEVIRECIRGGYEARLLFEIV